MRFRIEIPAAVALLLTSCAGPTFAPDEAPEYVVIRDGTPLYQYGPAQGSAPEAQIPKDERVRMIRHEFGYSLVQIPEGMTGYVANMDLAPAPALPEPPAVPVPAETEDRGPVPPPVEPPLPKPDLNATPTDAPVTQ